MSDNGDNPTDDAHVQSTGNLEADAETALVEVSPGTALVFGRTPEGLELIPFRLISQADQIKIGSAVAEATPILNVGAQVAAGLAQAQGLVRLAPETLAALRAGAATVPSHGYNIGVLAAQHGKFVAQVRWLPAGSAQGASLAASLGPALALLAIQAQLNEISGLVRENIALTETALKTVRHEQWAELAGLEQAVTQALGEATAIGEVTQLLWENVAGYEAPIQKQRDLFKRNVEAHLAELAKREGPQQRRQYVEKNGEAVLLDLHSLVLAHKSWFEYETLRAGRARLSADEDPRDAKLLDTIVEGMQEEHRRTVEQLTTLMDAANREFSLLAELPGKRTIPFTGARRSADDLKLMAQEMVRVVEQISSAVIQPPRELDPPGTIYLDKAEHLDQDLRILRWHLERDERLDAIATARELGVGSALGALHAAREIGSNGVLIALTDQRVLVADVSEFRNEGVLRRSVPVDEIRYVRLRDDDRSRQAEIDLITKDDNLAWRFADGSSSEASVRRLGALLSEHMEIPQTERDALRAALSPGLSAPKQLKA